MKFIYLLIILIIFIFIYQKYKIGRNISRDNDIILRKYDLNNINELYSYYENYIINVKNSWQNSINYYLGQGYKKPYYQTKSTKDTYVKNEIKKRNQFEKENQFNEWLNYFFPQKKRYYSKEELKLKRFTKYYVN